MNGTGVFIGMGRPDSCRSSAGGGGGHGAQTPLGPGFAAGCGHQQAGHQNLEVETAVETPGCWRWLKTDHLCWFKTDQGWRPRGTPLGCG